MCYRWLEVLSKNSAETYPCCAPLGAAVEYVDVPAAPVPYDVDDTYPGFAAT